MTKVDTLADGMRQRIVAASVMTLVVGLSVWAVSRSTRTSMVQATNNFLVSLTPEQRAKAQLKFDPATDDRNFWHYVPAEDLLKTAKKPRRGLTLIEMTGSQRHLAHAMLSAGLSQQGYSKAVTVMSLDDVLREIEGDKTGRRNSDKYMWLIFGEPSETGTWAFRVEGHHLSLHFTIVNGKVSAAPTFFGSNPAEIRVGTRKGLRTLAGEEDTGWALLDSLTPAQKAEAIVDKKAYPDNLTSATPKASLTGQPNGLAASKLNAKQRQLLNAIVEYYASNLPEDLAAHRMKQLKDAGSNLFFAWAGSDKRGEQHYYRVVSPTFLIEYDNTQNNANHIHSVWRDFKGDFGEDLLAAHYAASPHKK